MQFLLIITHDDAFAPTETLLAEIDSWISRMKTTGIRKYGNPLQPASDARTVRVRNGKTTITNGPFANSREKMCASELLECASLDEAVDAASRHPMAKAATIEVRPVWAELASQP